MLDEKLNMMLNKCFVQISLTILVLLMTTTVSAENSDDYAVATFAGGCFWCTQSDFDKVDGVIETTVGYTGGSEENPNYEQVSRGATGHAEALRLVFDPKQISYQQLLEIYWKSIDPTTRNRQFCDVGQQYRTAIFYHNNEQKTLAQQSKATLEQDKFSKVFTEITPAGAFYAAEDYHQNYYKKNPLTYKFYRFNCGRDKRLKEIWE